MSMRLIHGPDSQKQGPKVPHYQLHLAGGREKSMQQMGAFLWASLGSGIHHLCSHFIDQNSENGCIQLMGDREM